MKIIRIFVYLRKPIYKKMNERLEIYDENNKPNTKIESEIINFLFENLQEYGDPKSQIQKCVDYALSKTKSFGGKIFVLYIDNQIAGASIINHTGMSGYIPENILVYIATDKNQRGKGIGKTILTSITNQIDGDIALHVDRENPAVKLYEKFGFKVKYLEMRKIG